MPLILMIAAGILLAVVLLPFLGPLVLLALGIGGLILIGYLVIMAVGAVMAIFGLAKEAPSGARKLADDIRAARAQSLMGRVRSDPEFTQGLEAGLELGELAGLRGPGRLWHRYLLGERFKNCGHAGLFRVEDRLNRTHLERLLDRAARRCAAADAERARALSKTALDCHDSLCAQYPPKRR